MKTPLQFPLMARDGSLIPNAIDTNPTPAMVKLARQAIDRLVLANATQLQGPTGRYNCHGLVFASRRTNVPPVGVDVDIDDLLRHDGFEKIRGAPQVGDVAAYRAPSGEIEHTGLVCWVDAVCEEPVVRVWSMWGCLGEFCHNARSSPYSPTIEYWRLS